MLAANGVYILVNSIGRSEIPIGRDANLRRQNLDELAEAQQLRPTLAGVPVEGKGLVLRQDEYTAEIAVDAVGQRDVNNPVDSDEGNRRLGAVARERPQP